MAHLWSLEKAKIGWDIPMQSLISASFSSLTGNVIQKQERSENLLLGGTETW